MFICRFGDAHTFSHLLIFSVLHDTKTWIFQSISMGRVIVINHQWKDVAILIVSLGLLWGQPSLLSCWKNNNNHNILPLDSLFHSNPSSTIPLKGNCFSTYGDDFIHNIWSELALQCVVMWFRSVTVHYKKSNIFRESERSSREWSLFHLFTKSSQDLWRCVTNCNRASDELWK